MSSPDDIAKALADAFGGNDEESTVDTFLDTGYPELNHALANGWDTGLPVGRVVEIYGPESSGKTAIATAAMIAAQRQGGFAAFCDHERSFQQYLAVGQGLDPHSSKFMYKKPKTFEDSLGLCVATSMLLRQGNFIAETAPICWVFDSLAAMVPQSAMFDSKGRIKTQSERNMNDNTALARATSYHFPGLAQACDDMNICAIFLNQIRLDINIKYGNPEKTPGGKASKFYYSQRISLGSSKVTKGSGANVEVLGSEITAKIVKNKVSRPFRTAKWRFEFQKDGTGKFNVHRSMIEFLAREGILKKSGAYIEWDGKNYFAGPLADKLEAEPDGLDKLKALLPPVYEPPVVAEFDEETDASEPDAA